MGEWIEDAIKERIAREGGKRKTAKIERPVTAGLSEVISWE